MKQKLTKTKTTTHSTRNALILSEWNKVRLYYPRFPDFLTLFLKEEKEIMAKLSTETK